MSAEFDLGPQVERAATTFVEVTEYMPDTPLAGMLTFISDGIDMIREGEATWDDLVSMPFQRSVAKGALSRAVQSHRDNEVPDVPQLSSKMRFVLELVQGGTNRALAVLADGDDSVETTSFEEVNPAETAKAKEFLSHESNRQLVGELVTAIALKLGEDDHLEALDTYKTNITAISNEYKDVKSSNPRYEELMGKKAIEMNGQRREIMAVAGSKVMEALQPYSSRRPGVVAFGRALIAGAPSQALFAKHRHP